MTGDSRVGDYGAHKSSRGWAMRQTQTVATKGTIAVSPHDYGNILLLHALALPWLRVISP